MLKTGDKAPAFALPDESGQTVKSSALKGKPYVLYFYPKDDTPGCTKEACGFRDAMPDFGKLGVPVFGVSADSVARHRRFVDKYGLNFSLLSDEGHQLLEAYGVWVEKSMYGRKYFGIQRASFIVGADGRITHAWEKVKPEGHAEEVMAALRGQGGGKAAATKKAAAKKAAAKQPAATKKPAAKKAAAKKAGAGKAPAKKAPAKKAPAVKRAARAGGRGR